MTINSMKKSGTGLLTVMLVVIALALMARPSFGILVVDIHPSGVQVQDNMLKATLVWNNSNRDLRGILYPVAPRLTGWQAFSRRCGKPDR